MESIFVCALALSLQLYFSKESQYILLLLLGRNNMLLGFSSCNLAFILKEFGFYAFSLLVLTSILCFDVSVILLVILMLHFPIVVSPQSLSKTLFYLILDSIVIT